MRQAIEDWRNHRHTKAVTGFIRREWPIIAGLVALSTLVVLVIWVSSIASTVENSLCTFKGNLEDRVSQTYEFLEEHPEGIPGIPAETLSQSAMNQQSTVDALERGGLRCD